MTPKISQAIGKRFEDNCEAMHEEYMFRKMGFFWKNEIGSRMVYTVRGPRTQKLPSRPDFSGVLSSGRYVTYDAKSTANKTKWTLSKKNLHQQHHMEQIAQYHGLTFFLLEARFVGMCYILRVLPIVEMAISKRVTITFATANMDPNIIPFRPAGTKIDWLESLVRAGKCPFDASCGW